MSGRPRTSTLVLTGLFLAVLALYFWVRPVPVATSPARPALQPASVPSATLSPRPSRTHVPASVSPATATPSTSAPSPASPSPTPSPTASPTLIPPSPLPS
jgi:hypothetical protein